MKNIFLSRHTSSKREEGIFLFYFFPFHLWKSLEKDKECHKERHSHPESICVGIMKMLWASASWGAEAVLLKQVTDETLLAADY